VVRIAVIVAGAVLEDALRDEDARRSNDGAARIVARDCAIAIGEFRLCQRVDARVEVARRGSIAAPKKRTSSKREKSTAVSSKIGLLGVEPQTTSHFRTLP
jgi:hypothetical protein